MQSSQSVLIPTHGRPTLLGRTLDSLAACRLPAGYAETVVVENGSRAGAEAVVTEAAVAHPHLRLRYMHVERANKSHALNEALRTVGEGLVVFFDDDVRLAPGVLAAYAEAAEVHPERVFFGGAVEAEYETAPAEWLVPFFPPSGRGNASADGTLEIYLGANWAAYAHELLALGGFDPHYGPGSPTGARGQEGEMHLRLIDAGFEQCDVLDSVAWHYVPHERSTTDWLFRRMYQHGLMAGRYESAEAARLPLIGSALGNGVRCTLVAAKNAALRDEVGLWRALLGLSTNAGRLVGALQRPPRSTSAR